MSSAAEANTRRERVSKKIKSSAGSLKRMFQLKTFPHIFGVIKSNKGIFISVVNFNFEWTSDLAKNVLE